MSVNSCLLLFFEGGFISSIFANRDRPIPFLNSIGKICLLRNYFYLFVKGLETLQSLILQSFTRGNFVIDKFQIKTLIRPPYREPETKQNARPFWSSMAEWQRFGCLDTWSCRCKQILSLRFPIVQIVSNGCHSPDIHTSYFI